MMHEIDVLSDDELAAVVGGMMKELVESSPIPPASAGGANQDSNYSWWTLWNSMAHSLPPYTP